MWIPLSVLALAWWPGLSPGTRIGLVGLIGLVWGRSAVLYMALLLTLPLMLGLGSSVYRPFARFLIYDHLGCDTVLKEPDRPVIYVANYPSGWLDYFAPGVFPASCCILGSAQMGRHFARMAVPRGQIIVVDRPYEKRADGKRVVRADNGAFEKTLEQVREKTKKGLSIMCYVDSSATRKRARDIGPLYHGMFAFSRLLRIPIQPVALDPVRTNAVGAILNKRYWMEIGRRHVVEDAAASMREVREFLHSSLRLFVEREAGLNLYGDGSTSDA